LLNTTTLCYKKVFLVARIDILLCCYNTTTHGKTADLLFYKNFPATRIEFCSAATTHAIHGYSAPVLLPPL
jgi:hypothetical protein